MTNKSRWAVSWGKALSELVAFEASNRGELKSLGELANRTFGNRASREPRGVLAVRAVRQLPDATHLGVCFGLWASPQVKARGGIAKPSLELACVVKKGS